MHTSLASRNCGLLHCLIQLPVLLANCPGAATLNMSQTAEKQSPARELSTFGESGATGKSVGLLSGATRSAAVRVPPRAINISGLLDLRPNNDDCDGCALLLRVLPGSTLSY